MVRYGAGFLLFFGGCHNFTCILTSVPFNDGLVLIHFLKFVVILLFSDWSVAFVVVSRICIVQLNSRTQSVPSKGFMSSRLGITMFRFFLIPPVSTSTVICPRIFTWVLLTSLYFLLSRIFCCSLFFLSSGGFLVTGDPEFTITSVAAPIFCGNVSSSVGYKFCSDYFVHRKVGFVFFGPFGPLRSVISVISCCFQVLNSTNFLQMRFLLTSVAF